MGIRKFDTTATSPVRDRSRQRESKLRALARVHSESDPRAPVEWHVLDEKKRVIGREPGGDRIAFDDAEASRRHAEIEFVPESDVYRLHDLGSRNRTFIDGRAIESDYLQPGSIIRIGATLLVYAEIQLREGIRPFVPEPGQSLARMQAEAIVGRAAKSPLPILIMGPTGAGKELLAQRAHQESGRRGPLVPVNCSTFSRELIGSELFGHVAGAFSGAASSRAGLFAAANGGTLFLDEIAELPLDQQPALLRALQEGKVRPVGSDKEVAVDVRVVAATHQRLDEAVARSAFRADLHARLAGFVVDIPGLVARREEIVRLFRRFLGAGAPPLTSEGAEVLLGYGWPQNVRELKHAAERVALLSRDAEAIDSTDLPIEIREWKPHAAGAGGAIDPTQDEEIPTKEQLEKLLAEHDGNVARVARALGKHRQTLYRWLKKYDLGVTQFRKDEQE